MSPAPDPRGHSQRASARSSGAVLHDLIDRLTPEQVRPAFTHSSWTVRRSESYERLAFLGDSVLGLAVTTHLFPGRPTATAPAG